MSKRYFHLYDPKEIEGQKYTDFAQPPWCEYPEAVGYPMECWSLMFGRVFEGKGEAFCKKDCECYKNLNKEKE